MPGSFPPPLRSFTRLLALIAALAATSPLSAGGQSTGEAVGRKPITFADLDGLQGAGGVKLSPDGGRVTFHKGGAIWILSTVPGSTPRKVATGLSPTWSHAGTALAFYGRAEASNELQIFTFDLAADRSDQVTNVKGGVSADRIGWSVDDRLFFSAQVSLDRASDPVAPPAPEPASAERGTPLVLRRDSPDGYALAGILTGVSASRSQVVRTVSELFVHDLTTGETARLTHDEAGYHSPALSPDGKTIVCVSQQGRGRGVYESALSLIDGVTGEPTLLVPAFDTRKANPTWSPDGRSIAYAYYSFTDTENHGLAVVRTDGRSSIGEPADVLSLPVEGLTWSVDGRSLLVTYVDGVAQPVFNVDVATGETRIVGSANHVAFGSTLTVSRSGAVAWVESSGLHTGVILLLRPGSTEARQIYDPNPQMRDWALGEQEVVRWKNRHGHDRLGILIKPAGYEPGVRYPLIVSAYSQGTHLNGFQSFTHPGFANQAYASRGYAVFFPGPRLPWMYGSAAKSEAESEAIRGADGWDLTVDDIESGVDFLIERGIADPDRLVVMGHSNGGAAVAAIVTRTTRYRGAVAVAPANLNWVENALFEDNLAGRWIAPKTFTGIGEELWKNPEAYVRGSPVFQMHKVETPILLAVGDLDHPSFALPTVEAYLALRRAGKDVTLLRYADQRHSFQGRAAQDLQDRIMVFVEQRLARREEPGS